jgi:imidazolonepropionase-like amidohydrolase
VSDDAGLTAVRAGRLLDVERGLVQHDRVVIVRGDRIESVQSGTDRVPQGARLVDLSSQALLPGLIDCHTHLVGRIEWGNIPAVDRTAAQDALDGVANARATVEAGFTTVRDVGTYRAFVDVALRDAISQGTIPGPRMQVAGCYVTAPGGGGEVTGLAPDVVLPADLRFGVAASPEEIRRRVRAILAGGADFIKVIATGAVLTRGTDPGLPEFSEDEIRAAVETAADRGAHVAAHAHGAEGIKRAVRAGVRSIEHGSLMDDEAIALMAERGTYLVADVYDGDWIAAEGSRAGWPEETLRKNQETTEAQRHGFRRAVEAGVRMAFGTDSGVYPHGWNARQFAIMTQLGMSAMDAIRSATVVAADLLRWQDRVGSVSPGKFADLVAVDGDPLDDISVLERPSFVMKAGQVVVGPS